MAAAIEEMSAGSQQVAVSINITGISKVTAANSEAASAVINLQKDEVKMVASQAQQLALKANELANVIRNFSF